MSKEAEKLLENKQTKNTMTTDTLFNIEPTKPTKLQAARRALADAERELAKAQDSICPIAGSLPPEYQRAVDRFAQLVRDEEAAELNNSKQNIV